MEWLKEVASEKRKGLDSFKAERAHSNCHDLEMCVQTVTTWPMTRAKYAEGPKYNGVLSHQLVNNGHMKRSFASELSFRNSPSAPATKSEALNMALLQRIQAAQNLGARREFSDVDELRAFVSTEHPDRSVRVNIRMRLFTATDEDNGCRLALLTRLQDEAEFRAVCDGLKNLSHEASIPFLFLVLVWGASANDFNFVEGDHINLDNVYALQDWKGRRLGGTVRQGDVARAPAPLPVVQRTANPAPQAAGDGVNGGGANGEGAADGNGPAIGSDAA